MSLEGVTVLVAGAGLAGLVAARDLSKLGATVTVLDTRDRVGGRVWTIRDRFAERQHAEAGGDIIDEAQGEIRSLVSEVGLKLNRVLRHGWAYARRDRTGRVRIVHRAIGRGWERIAANLEDLARPYRLAEQRWDSPIAAAIGRRSVADWLDERRADDELRTTALGLRGFFLADPEELSLLALVDQFASETPAFGQQFRIEGGNDRLASVLAAQLSNRVRLGTELVAVSHSGREVRATVRNARTIAHLTSHYLVLAMPTTILRRIPIRPALPAQQHEAIAQLKYGRATKTLLQFSRRFWKAPGRPQAFGSPMAFGAVWEGTENQRGKAGILTIMAGGGASDATQAIVAQRGTSGLATELDWLGSRGAEQLASHQVVWEADPCARGGYAFFDPGFDPALRAWLARPFGRLFFAGEHTSIKWQGYMNGAVESGRRAAAEIDAVHRMA